MLLLPLSFEEFYFIKKVKIWRLCTAGVRWKNTFGIDYLYSLKKDELVKVFIRWFR